MTLANRPIALRAAEAEEVAAALRGHLAPQALSFYQGEERPEYALVDGVALIPILGVLSNTEASGRWWGGTGYGWIRQGLVAALDDTAVRAIAFMINSPGGDVAG
jgi:ClpP class serine protease